METKSSLMGPKSLQLQCRLQKWTAYVSLPAAVLKPFRTLTPRRHVPDITTSSRCVSAQCRAVIGCSQSAATAVISTTTMIQQHQCQHQQQQQQQCVLSMYDAIRRTGLGCVLGRLWLASECWTCDVNTASPFLQCIRSAHSTLRHLAS